LPRSLRNVSHSHIILLAVAIAALATPALAAQKCTLVRVVVNGCEDLKNLPEYIRVKIAGSVPITLQRQQGGSYGGTVGPSDPTDRTHTLNVLDLPVVRTACDVPPKRDPDVQSDLTCRVFYDVPCEPFWSLNVTAKKKGPSLEYHCQPRPPLIQSCDNSDLADDSDATPLDPDSPLTISPLARSQYLILGLQIPGGKSIVKYRVGQDVLQRRGRTAKLSQLHPMQDATGQEVTNDNMGELKRKQTESMDNITLSLN